jgi:acyl carrier protein
MSDTNKEINEIKVVDPIHVNCEQPTQDVMEIVLDLTNLEASEITPETKLDEFLDSLDIVEIAVQIERKLNCHISDLEIEGWETMTDIIDTYIKYQN